MAWIVSFLLKALVVLGISKVVPGMKVRGFGTALAVALVYAFLSVALKWLLVLLSLPMIILTFGLFLFVVNAFLLWITDKLIEGVELTSKTSLLIAAVLMTLGNVAVEGLVERIVR